MKSATILGLAVIACLSACSATSPRSSAAPPPFECTSIHPGLCKLEQEFHRLRFEQAEQNAAIEAAELRRRAQQRDRATAAARSLSVTGSLLDSPAG